VGVTRILFLADTHLGFDHPFKPRVYRRRRGPDFFRNYEQALQPAYRGEVNIVVHGGDIFYRSKVPAKLVDIAFLPLKRVADLGVPVYIVPGNHERSNIPYSILAAHPNIFIFDKPVCFSRRIRDVDICLAGFPFVRYGIRGRFSEILAQTGWRNTKADVYFLCMHQSVDGATMGPKNFRFRGGDDVIDIHTIPSAFTAALTGHMHRNQVVDRDLKGRRVATPVLYAGALERTSFAEKDERKGYMIIGVNTETVGNSLQWEFHELRTRPMVQFNFDADGMSKPDFLPWLKDRISKVPADSIVRIQVRGMVDKTLRMSLSVNSLRAFVPETMNVTIRIKQDTL
jgi:DNA repair exonuclease SbcCD nuclease subunit